MFSKFAAATIFATAVIAQGTKNQCNVGKMECCKSVQKPTAKQVVKQLGTLDISVDSVQGLVGLNCSPITGVGIGAGANCNASPVCCKGNNFNGVIVLGCTPLTVNL